MGKHQNLPDAPEYPHLSEAADPKTLTRILNGVMGPSFAADNLEISRCKLKRIYYKPGPEGHFRMHIRALIQHPDLGSQGEQTFLAQMWPAHIIEEQHRRALSRDLVRPEHGEPVVLIPQWNMLLWAYPNDPRLLGLAELSNPEKVLANMQAMPRAYGIPKDHKPVSIQAQLTKYVPSQRCGSIFRVKLDAPNSGESEHSIYGKAYRTHAGPAAFDIACQVWDSEPRRRGELFLPEPISYDEDLHIFWQGALPGRPLAKTATGEGLVDIADEIGRRLASFHSAELDLPVKRTFATQCADLAKSVEAICSNFPDHAERCSEMHERLLTQIDRLGPEQRTPVHGSFKFSHIFVGDGQIAFIDFDGATLGDPTYDVGRLVAHLAEMQASSKMPAAIAEQTIDRFTRGYLDNTALPMSEDRIRWYSASLIVSSQVAKAVKRFDPGLIGKLLTLAESIAPDA